MYQRNFKNNKTISTYPCNTGYVTEMSDQYGRRIKEIFSYTIEEARQQHRRYLSYANNTQYRRHLQRQVSFLVCIIRIRIVCVIMTDTTTDAK